MSSIDENRRIRDIVERALNSAKHGQVPHEYILGILAGAPAPESLAVTIWEETGHNISDTLDALELAQQMVEDAISSEAMTGYLLALRNNCLAYRRIFRAIYPDIDFVTYNPKDLLATELGLMHAYNTYVSMKVNIPRPTPRYPEEESAAEMAPGQGFASPLLGSRAEPAPSVPVTPGPGRTSAGDSEEPPAKRGRRLFADDEETEEPKGKPVTFSSSAKPPSESEPVAFTDVKYGEEAATREHHIVIISNLIYLLEERKAARATQPGPGARPSLS